MSEGQMVDKDIGQWDNEKVALAKAQSALRNAEVAELAAANRMFAVALDICDWTVIQSQGGLLRGCSEGAMNMIDSYIGWRVELERARIRTKAAEEVANEAAAI